MDFIKTFESFQYSIDNLSKLNEDQVDELFKQSLGNILGGAKLTDKTSDDIKNSLKEKLSGIESKYEASLSKYISEKYNENWYKPLLDLVTAPGSGFITVIGAKADETEMTKKREAAKDKALAEEAKGIVDDAPVLALFLKNIALNALPAGVTLSEGMETKNIKPNAKELSKLMYEASLEIASKLFDSATSGLSDLSDIKFEFETIPAKIEKNNQALDKYREELLDLDKSDNDYDFAKKIEMYVLINTLRSQQCALMAAQAEYEFLTGSVKRTFVGSIQGYAQALFEIAFFVVSSIILSKLITAVGQLDFIRNLKETVSAVTPTVIPGFQQAVNKVMNEVINPLSKEPMVMGAIAAAYTILRGNQLQEELEFEQNEKFMLLALEQFVPTISAVNSVISICDSSFSTFNSAIKELSAVKIWGDAINASDEEKERFIKKQRQNMPIELYNLSLANMKSENSPLLKAVQSMEVSSDIKSSLNVDSIFNSPTRGATGIYSFATKLGVDLDFLKNIEDIFDRIESPLMNSVENNFISDNIYTKYINKENPTHGALGGLIFLSQSIVILENPSKFLPFIPEFPTIPRSELPSFKRTMDVGQITLSTIPEIIDFSEPDVESCGVFVSIIDEDQKIYKSRVGMLYFEKNSAFLDETKTKTGIDGFSQLLKDYKFNFVVVGNADVSGPQEQKNPGGFIGNRLLSELRANTFLQSAEKTGDEKFSALGCGKMYARNYTDYIRKDLSTSKIASALGVSKSDENFNKNMADDRRIEVIIFPENVDFKNFSNNDPIIEKVCKRPFDPNDDSKLIRMKNGKWFISKDAESKYNLRFSERKAKSTNESSRKYILPFNSFM